jgi:hypothetical protein
VLHGGTINMRKLNVNLQRLQELNSNIELAKLAPISIKKFDANFHKLHEFKHTKISNSSVN